MTIGDVMSAVTGDGDDRLPIDDVVRPQSLLQPDLLARCGW